MTTSMVSVKNGWPSFFSTEGTGNVYSCIDLHVQMKQMHLPKNVAMKPLIV